MIFKETPLAGAFVVEAERTEDDRGSFATLFSAGAFEARGLDIRVAQTAVSFNRQKGTLRGMHFQLDPHGQAKLVRCLSGAIYDVIVDVRRNSPTFRSWHAVELTAANMLSLFVPVGFAHGFETLEEASSVGYQISTPRHEESERGLRWNDPALGITWPFQPVIISERDSSFPYLAGRTTA